MCDILIEWVADIDQLFLSENIGQIRNRTFTEACMVAISRSKDYSTDIIQADCQMCGQLKSTKPDAG